MILQDFSHPSPHNNQLIPMELTIQVKVPVWCCVINIVCKLYSLFRVTVHGHSHISIICFLNHFV